MQCQEGSEVEKLRSTAFFLKMSFFGAAAGCDAFLSMATNFAMAMV
jgi:hypothetical protein